MRVVSKSFACLAVTQRRRTNRLEGLKVKVNLLLLALIGKDGAAVNDQTVGRNPVVKLEATLGRGDGGED